LHVDSLFFGIPDEACAAQHGLSVGQRCRPRRRPERFGHVGGGGSFGYVDPDRHLAIALAKNYLCRPSVGNSTVFVPEEGPQRVYEAVAGALGILR
jgi:CubicO group peptidase (beta-lactamase class C family)